MPLSLAQLVSQPDLGLRMITHEPGALAGQIEWVSSSDLADPTPFFAPRQVLLTTGTQFLGGGRREGEFSANGARTGPAVSTDYDSYVERLHAAGATALGYGTEVIREGVPGGLVQACRRVGLPLFEVPYRTPFIALIRYVADGVAAASHARELWAINAQRAISFAALRPNPLAAVLAELARLLGRRVVLFAAPGPTVSVFGTGTALTAEMHGRMLAEAERLLARGQRSAATLRVDTVEIGLQTIGRRGDLRGVLAIAGGPLPDAADHSVITNVVALAGLALGQGRGLRRARRALRSGLLEVLLDGKTGLARLTLQQIHEALPAEPVRVALWRPEHGAGDPLLRELDEDTQSRPGRAFFGTLGREIIAIFPAGEAPERALHFCDPLGAGSGPEKAAPAPELRAGLSDAVGYAELRAGIDQARRALDGPRGAGPVTTFAELGGRTLTALLTGTEAAERARAILAPLREHDAHHGTELLASLAAWLDQNGQWDPAARELGIHRHTLRARITLVESLTEQDLSGMASRTNFWLALHTV
ncbi:helix-turn-helix domain-containing protein [Mycetocola spongiae]|uniref:helix-turn-helix domain-containing protein n=1 Tax=Mycetocola spongiae TaxID=2859226 RepID=UPI001CF410EE|nr:PucR family transcriptional regulator [Mycetocola spongiae]UCR87956.1 PucR family transcriptional regulator [Mycetocola spongiae]